MDSYDNILPEDQLVQEPQQVPISKDDMSKTIKAFLDDEKLENFKEILQNFFSKHILLSFLDDKDISILMLQFDNALTNYVIFNDVDWVDMTKIDQVRMMFFAALKRAKGRRDNERELLAKNISENITSLNQPQLHKPTFKRWLFG